MKLSNALAVSSAVLLLACLPAGAQTAYGDWDANASGGIDAQEWNTGWGRNGVFDRFDANSDGRLDRTEFDSGVSGGTTGSVGADAGSGFNDRFGDTAYADWDGDQDGYLSQSEFDEGVFGGYDADNSGMIEEPEFGDVGDDMGDGGFWDV